ncbi:ParA family protein [Tenacibaculum aiptasiae]|uniref:ParA family protein n=1 Tax=Tenacibaculum aiptasiae TaxID=426481 RepID=UPI00232DA401|nr:ParA family protein [Tenacibaculum aiptasiae]
MGKIILITHQKGGVGKSTLTFNLAQNISENASVAILDLDLQGSLSQVKELASGFDIIPYKGKILMKFKIWSMISFLSTLLLTYPINYLSLFN